MSQLTLPTLVTLLRLLAVPLVILGLSIKLWSPWWTLSFFCGAAWTDWLDGYLARRLNQETDLGRFLDPLVDKLLVLGPMMALIERGILPAWGVFLIVARDLIISGWRVNQPTVSGANQWGKLKTVVQLSAIAGLLIPTQLSLSLDASVLNEIEPHWILVMLNQTGMWLFWISLPLTVFSALIYLWPSITGATKGRPQGEE